MGNRKARQYLFALFLILIASSIIISISQAISKGGTPEILLGKSSRSPIEFSEEFLENIINNIMGHVKVFSSFKTRVTGYPGSLEAANYIYDFFVKIGLSPEKKGYSIAIPLSRESYITVGNSRFNAEPLWPNGVQTCKTPPGGITGRLVYIGDGRYEEIEGKDLVDSIAIMDFNSRANWIRAADLGAKAIIFIEPDSTTSLESLKKAVSAPINIPRLYVSKDVGEELIKLSNLNQQATIFNDMRWEEITAYNIVAIVEGSIHPEEIIIVSAHYDSWSVVPTLAYGAEDSLSVATLLEIARYFSENRPVRTLMFVAFSGFYQATAGSTNFVEQFFFQEDIQNGSKKIVLHIGLDFSTESDGLDLLYTGPPSGAWLRGEWGSAWFGDLQLFASRYASVRSYVEKYVANLKEKTSLNIVLQELYKWGTQPSFRDWNYLYRLDTLNTIKTGVLAFTLRTSWAYRTKWFTPLEDYQYIKWDNFKPQLKLAFSIIEGFSNETTLNIEKNIPTRYYQHFVAAYFLGYITLNVKVVEYNMSRGWYVPVPNALVRYLSGDPNEYLFWPFNSYSRFSDNDGNVAFYGLIPYRQFTFDAWKFNEGDGSIIYAVDRGIYGTSAEVAGGISNIAIPVAHPYNLLIPVFKCAEVAFFDIFDVRYIRKPYTTFTTIPYRLSVYDLDRKAEPIFYGGYFDPNNGVGSVFVRNNSKIIITFNPNPAETKRPLILLTNSSSENTEGYGLSVDKPLIIRNTMYRAARDIYWIALGRYERLKEKNVRNRGAEILLESAKLFIEKAEMSLKEKDYKEFISSSITALAYASGAYNGCVMPLIDESGVFLLSFTPIVIVFSVLFERFALHMYGLKRIIGVLILLTITLVILGFLTPLFIIVSNSVFMVLGVGILLLSIFIIAIFLKESKELMEYIAETKLGHHIIRTEKTAAMIHSLGVAVDNLRKHFFISITALVTIIIMSAAITTFTSASYTIGTISTSREGYTPLYEGILVKRLWGIPPDAQRGGVLDTLMIEYLNAICGEDFIISPRVWKYPSSVYAPNIGILGVKTPIESLDGARIISPLVLYGASSNDIEKTFSNSLIYFDKQIFDSHKESCLIPNSLAEKLNVTLGMTISLKNPGVNLIVVGIFDALSLSELRDLDGWSILPIDPMYSPTIYRIETPYTETSVPQPIRGDNIIIIRWDKAIELDGLVSSISILPKNQEEMGRIYEIASKIALGIDATIYVGYRNTIKSFNKVLTYEFGGWSIMMVLVILAVLSIVNNILATLHRRRNEVFVYASVGLSPAGAMLIFIVEGITYGILASVIGYLLGYGMIWAFTTLYPGTLTFNINSLFIMVSLGAIIGSCMAASIYPSILAAKLITPSLERRWKPPTKPRGDIWTVPLPFRSPYRDEALGVLRYLKEYYSGIGFERRGFVIQKITEIDVDNLALTINVALLPSELNISQEVKVYALYGENNYVFFIDVKRISGDPSAWVKRCIFFLSDIRQQLLLWKSLPDKERKKYLLMEQ